jgi:MoaA/NifB/PqqE/SkfB family radical SAM enzyme
MKEAMLSRPFILDLSLNKISKTSAKTKTLDEQAYRCVCDYIRANSNGVIVLTGGEPFSDSRLSEILVLARSRGWSTSVDTSCLFHELPTLDGIQQIRLRLYSLNPNLHNRIASNQQSFQKTMEYARWLADNYSGEKIMVFPVCRDNYREIAAVFDWCCSLNFIPNFFVVPRQHEYFLDLQDYCAVLQTLRKLPPEDIIIDVPLLGLSGWSNICPGG